MALPDQPPLLILVSAGGRSYREQLLRSLAGAYRVHLITGAEPTWERPYLTDVSVLPSTDVDSVRARARAIADVEPVAAVLTWGEEHLLQAAVAAEDLGLPGSRADAVLRCWDKFATRQALARRDVPQPAFALVGDAETALAAAREIGYPVVLKPRSAAASEGVVLVRDGVELTREFDVTRGVRLDHRPSFEDVVLVEQYLAGPEISIDAAIHAGTVTPVFVARKEIGFPPLFEETGHQVSGFDPLLTDPELGRLLTDIHAAIGYTDGWTHTELKVTEAGLKTIEVNGRLGGDLIPYLGSLATGIDPALAAAAVARGEAPELVATRARVAAVRFFYPPWDGCVIESVEFDRPALPPEIDLCEPLVTAGDVVSLPRNGHMEARVAYAVAVADTAEEVHAALGAAQAALRLRVGAAG
jgi:biotin carboxylase